MPTFTPIGRRLVLRYREGTPFSFNRVHVNANAEGLMDLANAIESLQEDEVRMVTTVLTSRLG